MGDLLSCNPASKASAATISGRSIAIDAHRPQNIGAYWGGEYGTEKLTHYLKAEQFLIYAPATPPTALITKARMRLAAEGNTEILEMFWHPELVNQPRVIDPPLLAYADLMATTDGRNIEAAKEVYERFLEPIVRQP